MSMKITVGFLILLLLFLQAGYGEFTFDATVPLHPEVEAAIKKAQQWLTNRQQKNGSWGNNGANALVTMALMVNGTTPGKGDFGSETARAVDFLISTQTPAGLMNVTGQGQMYQHALATLALAEAYGMTHNPKIRESLIKAVDLIVGAQDYGGGWRYVPTPTQGDLSVSVMQVMALRAAAETGIYVPDETIEHAVKFIKDCWVKSQNGFSYMARGGGMNFNRSAAGVVCLQSVGLHDDPTIPLSVETVSKIAFAEDREKNHFWYGHYYASVALYHYGGDAWKNYYPRICEKILADWEKKSYYSVIDTAWAILVMGVPYRYLPVYQR